MQVTTPPRLPLVIRRVWTAMTRAPWDHLYF